MFKKYIHTIGKEDARESEIRKAALLANAHEFIRYGELGKYAEKGFTHGESSCLIL